MFLCGSRKLGGHGSPLFLSCMTMVIKLAWMGFLLEKMGVFIRRVAVSLCEQEHLLLTSSILTNLLFSYWVSYPRGTTLLENHI